MTKFFVKKPYFVLVTVIVVLVVGFVSLSEMQTDLLPELELPELELPELLEPELPALLEVLLELDPEDVESTGCFSSGWRMMMRLMPHRTTRLTMAVLVDSESVLRAISLPFS